MIEIGGNLMYSYGGYNTAYGYGNPCCYGGGYGAPGGYGVGYVAAIVLVLFILLIIVIGARGFGSTPCPTPCPR